MSENQNQQLWGARFSAASSKLLEEFNASIHFDRLLYREDIEGSQAHVVMLAREGIVTDAEAEQIAAGLEQVKGEIDRGEFVFSSDQEDIHMAIEKRLTALIGPVGGKLHTARSRNDQVALDFRLWTLRQNRRMAALLHKLITTIVSIADRHTGTLMPGMTHLQHAQPVSFGYHMMAYAAMFQRDFQRFSESATRNNISPLGCAALAGTPHPIDRQQTAGALGFEGVSLNCMDTVSDRDFALEFLFNSSVCVMHMSRLCEELILWSSAEFGFVTISDQFATGSSIMPQKKNPDVAELIRGKTGRVYGNLVGLLTVMKALPLAYNKDTQEDKEGVFDSAKALDDSLVILEAMLGSMQINGEKMAAACKRGHLTATDLADFLTQSGVPFREAYGVAGRAAALADEKGLDVSDLSLADLRSLDSRLGEAVLPKLQLKASMAARKSPGGTAPCAVKQQIEQLRSWLATTEPKS
jgi:argininosuccinate lyase